MSKNTNTYKLTKIKSKYETKNKTKSKNKSKRLLKKMLNSSLELDDVDSLIDSSTLEENIQILTGGKIVEPSELDKIIFGYKVNVDTTGPIDKLYDNAKNTVDTITNSFGNFVNIVEGLIARKMITVIGMEGKNPEEVAEILKNDSDKLREISEFLETDKGKEMLYEIENLSKKATGIIGESIEQIPEQLDDSMEKMAHAGLKITKGLATEVPVIAPIIGASEAVKGAEDAFNATTDAIENIANLTSDTAENLKTPVDDIKKEINNISSEVENISNEFENTQQLLQTQELPIINQVPQREELQKNDEFMINKNIQYGGSDINKFNNLLQNGGKKLRKRINNTRHAFKNISRNITKKNK
jgi:hypothetical protein